MAEIFKKKCEQTYKHTRFMFYKYRFRKIMITWPTVVVFHLVYVTQFITQELFKFMKE